MIKPTPALATRAHAQRLPRWALLLLCAAYVLPGVVGRDPWKSADSTAFGYMLAIAEGRSPWMSPLVGGMAPDSALLPHWLGAAAIALLSPLIDPALASRLPYALMLALTLVLTWYTSFALARTEAARPLALAFGGEASTVDYARAVADGALLALIASLGLLQLGHETTPELVQLFAAALFLWSLALAPYRRLRSRLAVVVALPLLAVSGAPSIALGAALAGFALCLRSAYPQARRFAPWVAVAGVLALTFALALDTFAWHVRVDGGGQQVLQLLRLLAWFLWPVWPLVLWTLWRWRRHSMHRHIALPLAVGLVTLIAAALQGSVDRVLMLGLPAWAVLAAFALPTLSKGASAVIDWFALFFFSFCALAVWVVTLAMHTGVPAQPAANVARLAPGFEPVLAPLALIAATLATLAWVWVVRWRTARLQHALWKGLVVSAGGVTLIWLLLMTLWLPLLDYARSYRPWVAALRVHIAPDHIVCSPNLTRSAAAALEHLGRWRVDLTGTRPDCDTLLVADPRIDGAAPAQAGWTWVARERRPTERDESVLIYRRSAATP